MKSRIAAVAVCVAVSSALAVAQPSGEMPKPGPEHKKLDFFVGKWKSEGMMNPNPFMPAGKFTSNDSCDWFAGGYAVVCHSDGSGPMGPSKGLGILGYNAEAKIYTYYGVDNTPMVMVSVPRGTIEGKKWTYNDEAEMGGQTMKSRYVITETSATSYTFKWEMVGEDGSWTTIVEGKATKAS